MLGIQGICQHAQGTEMHSGREPRLSTLWEPPPHSPCLGHHGEQPTLKGRPRDAWPWSTGVHRTFRSPTGRSGALWGHSGALRGVQEPTGTFRSLRDIQEPDGTTASTVISWATGSGGCFAELSPDAAATPARTCTLPGRYLTGDVTARVWRAGLPLGPIQVLTGNPQHSGELVDTCPPAPCHSLQRDRQTPRVTQGALP